MFRPPTMAERPIWISATTSGFIDESLTKTLQRHHRLHLLLGHRRRAPRGVSGQDRAGDPPTSTNEIKNRISSLVSDDVDVVITEIGGTVGDIEILPYLEAIRQVRLDVGRGNVCYIHVTLVPFIGPTGEQKTKPTQHSVTELRSRGVQPDAIVCRSESPISDELKRKISSLCDVDVSAVVNAADADSIYEIPWCSTRRALTAWCATYCAWTSPSPI